MADGSELDEKTQVERTETGQQERKGRRPKPARKARKKKGWKENPKLIDIVLRRQM
jgi:hypothetical protein